MSRRRRKRTASGSQSDFPGWVWMLFGLAIGLAVAFAIYMKDRGPAPTTRIAAREPASLAPASAGPAAAEPAAKPPAEPRFSFYSMLPNFEVVIPEQETDVRSDRNKAIVEEPGVYILQAGSFSAATDADRRRAELALLGIESRVQRVSIDDRTYHRVRIGPIDDLDRLNRVRDQLRRAGIDALRIRLPD